MGPHGGLRWTGKTFALDAAREAWHASGFVVCGAAVARQAVRGMWDAAGIPSTSVAALLGELGRGAEWGMTARTVLVIDEAGMLGTRDLAQLLSHAAPADAKVVLVGDHHQLPEIDAGGLFRALVARTDPVRLTVNRRQQEPHARAMLDLWRQARVRDALTIASEHGELVLAENAEQLQARMVADYCNAIGAGEDAVMITERRADARDLNTRARAWLDGAGRLGDDRIELSGGQFAVGDRVVLKLNDRRLNVENGNRGIVIAIDPGAGTLGVQLSGQREVTLPRTYLQRKTTTRDPALLHAYAGTAHIAQGITTGHAFVLGSDTTYREWGYVAWSRARLQTRFYVCEPDIDLIADKHHTAAGHEPDAFEGVVSAMERSRAQHPAIELVDGGRGQNAALAAGETRSVAAPSALLARRDPPAYVVSELGERPVQTARAAAWDCGVALVERYRVEHGVSSADSALGPRPSDLLARVAWRNALRDIERVGRELARTAATRSVGRSL